MISWNVVKNDINPKGLYTHHINWNPPKGSGFIVQRVEVDDPVGLISGYERPYYEAWRVEDGIVLDEGLEGTDDSFSNCCDGIFDVTEDVQDKMKENCVDHTYVAYNCLVYWAEDDSEAAAEISKWKRANEIQIIMAGKLRASYTDPVGLEKGVERLFKAEFIQDEQA